METLQDSGGSTRLVGRKAGSVVLTLPTSKKVNPLRIVESDNLSGKVTDEKPYLEMDPYKELELYLAKVNDELGGIIDTVPKAASNFTLEEKHYHYSVYSKPPRISTFRSRSSHRPEPKVSDTPRRPLHSLSDKEAVVEWSETILAEFNTIIANEIHELTLATQSPKHKNVEERHIDYKDLLNEFGINDSDSSGDDGIHQSRGRSRLRRTQSARGPSSKKLYGCIRKPNNPKNDGGKGAVVQPLNKSVLNSDYDEPRDRIVSNNTKQGRRVVGKLEYSLNDNSDYDEPSNCLPMDSRSTNDVQRINHNSSSLPMNFAQDRSIDTRKYSDEPKNNLKHVSDLIDAKPKTDPMPRSTRMMRTFGKLRNGDDSPNAQLPPRQQQDFRNRKCSLPSSLTGQKRRKVNHARIQRFKENENNCDHDYDDVFEDDDEIIPRSKSLENNVPKLVRVVPIEEKKTPFSRLLRKRHTPIYVDSSSDAILVRVASLPDEYCVNSSNDGKKVVSTKEMKQRAISPLTSRSDISAKRLSESDKDISQVSPVELRKFNFNRSVGNDVAVSCDFPATERSEVDGCIENGTVTTQENVDEEKANMDDQSSRSVSLPISLQSLLSRLKNGSGSCCPNVPPVDDLTYSEMATQTSPALSRSSSFTWVSDCDSPRAESHADVQSLQDETTLDHASPQNTVDDDNRSSSSSQDLLQSMDEISSGSLSPDTTDRASPLESGIGTASPPRSTERRMVKPLMSPTTPMTNKCYRKETWERIRRRPSKVNIPSETGTQDVWVKRESVHTQTGGNDDQYSPEMVDSSSGLDDSLPRVKVSRPKNLPLGLSTTASSSLSSGELLETPPRAPSSPSTASLQLKNEPLSIDLVGKSTSAPLLDNETKKSDDQEPILQQPRSQSERQLSEIEAQEACKWLRAAGFPQYAQMYEDYQFPIDVSGVAKDHPFLEADSLQSLFRRLHALNHCANMKLDTHHSHHNTSNSKNAGGGGDDSDEDTQCALSENWTFENKTKRWSRIVDITPANVERLQAIADQTIAGHPTAEEDLDDRFEADETEDTMDPLRYRSLPPGVLPDELVPRFRRTGSERLRDGAKAFLKRMESLKTRRRKQHNRDGVIISSPQVMDVLSMQQKMKDLNCVDVSPTEGSPPHSFSDLLPPSPLHHLPPSPLTLPATPYHLPPSPLATTPSPFGDDSSSYCSDGSQGGGPTPAPMRPKMSKAKRFLHRSREDQGALSDSECQPTSWKHRYFKDANSNNAKIMEYVTHTSSPKVLAAKNLPITPRGGSLNLGKESQRYRDKLSQGQEKHKEDKVSSLKREDRMHKSLRSGRSEDIPREKTLLRDVTIYREKSRTRADLAGSQESSSTVASRDSDQEEDSPKHKGTVVRWHSFQRGSLYPESQDPLCPRAMASMSCGQLLVLRKLALLKLTACMERYCPTHRTGWNWELPKFIRKIKTPDYKDKTVFGVPLLLSLQRTGQALPKCIQIALKWLRTNALDQIGIFRKSGVRSRIQKLKAMTETQGDNCNFDGHQAYDVADLVKQYFRELPEALLTNKLSETFIAIFQHVPVDLRPDAVQCVLLLLPDEHREALETLLDFLNTVANHAHYNQMTASNLAVCLAPSLFHFNHSNSNVTNRSSSVSPRRRKTVGIPDPRELAENKAAHDCLLYLIKTHRELFMVSSDMLTQCHFNYMEESIPVALEELGSELKQDWRGYLYACTTALLKEAREKSRGWVTVNNPADMSVEVAYKKVGDGHPLRLWRVSTEVEAPPNELLQRVLRERHIWDPQLLQYRPVSRLDTNVEVFHYATGNMTPLPARDYCVLRSWRSDYPKGACVIVETSVEHPDATVMRGGTRGIVLASRYLIEPCGSGRSRIMHLSRVDTKGRTPEWYNKSYGHIAALHLSKIRNSFKHTTDGPESKV